jgi:hypothetical protein
VTYRRLPDNLPDLLKKAGLQVVEIDGWRTRGRPVSTGEFKPVGSNNHHDARKDEVGDTADDLQWAKWLFLTGRGTELPPPLCQLALSMEGVVYVGASGRANHAGVARPSGSVAGGDGNALYVGTEWMLSGTQAIPKTMYDAAIKLNGVLLDVLGSSVQAISCHYQTSTTGKWDIGDPNGVPFNGHKVLNVPLFRDHVKKWRASRSPVAPETDFVVVKAMHASLQFSDTPKQQTEDITDLFERAKKRGVWFITGTEAGPGAEPTSDLLASVGKAAGYHVWVPSNMKKGSLGGGWATDSWVAVDSDRIKRGSWDKGYEPAIPGSKELYRRAGVDAEYPRWGPKGVVWVSFENVDIGRVGVAAAHYLTKGRSPKGQPIQGVDHYEWNKTLAAEIGDWGREHGKGSALAFYGGDQNIVDRTDDTFFGQPFTSAWDELNKYENTGHGNIDVIASWDADGRVEALRTRALDDKEFFQHSDHFVVEAEFKVRKIKEAS